MAKFVVLVVLSVICAVGYAKHIHPRNMVHTDDDKVNESEIISTDIDGMPIVSTSFFYFQSIGALEQRRNHFFTIVAPKINVMV